MDPSTELTILLTLKDRVPFTFRWLAYANRMRLPYRILIADGGADEAVARALTGSHGYALDIDYRRYPFDTDYTCYYAKIVAALSHVQSRFVVIADNDDFFLPDGLAHALQFMVDHPGYSACGGQSAVFWMSPPGDHGKAAVDWKCSSRFHSDVADTARQRVFDQATAASDVFYAIRPTAQAQRQFQLVKEVNPRDLFLVEQLVGVLTAITGKTRQLETLYIARQQHAGGSGGNHQEQFGNWFERMLQPTWSEDFEKFVRVSAAALAEADGIPLSDARAAIITSYRISVAPSLLADLLDEPTVTSTMPIVLHAVRQLVGLPETSALKRLARRIYRRTRWVSHDLVHGTEFRARGAARSAAELRPVLDFLGDHIRPG